MLSSSGRGLCWKKASLLLASTFTPETSAGLYGQRRDMFTMRGSSPSETLLQEQMFRVQKEQRRSPVTHTPDQMLSGSLEKNIFCKFQNPLISNVLELRLESWNHSRYLKTQLTCRKPRNTFTAVHTLKHCKYVEVAGEVAPEYKVEQFVNNLYMPDNVVC